MSTNHTKYMNEVVIKLMMNKGSTAAVVASRSFGRQSNLDFGLHTGYFAERSSASPLAAT